MKGFLLAVTFVIGVAGIVAGVKEVRDIRAERAWHKQHVAECGKYQGPRLPASECHNVDSEFGECACSDIPAAVTNR